MQRFLIVKTSSIGDVIQSFHLIPYLKKRFPGCEIDWVVEKGIAPLLHSHPDLSRVIEVDTKIWRKNLMKHWRPIRQFAKTLRQKKYDALFDLQGNTKSAVVTALARAGKKVGYSWRSLPEKTNFFVTNVHYSCQEGMSVRRKYLHLLLEYFGDEEPQIEMELQLNLGPEERSQLNRLLQLGFEKPRIMICFGSYWKNKRLTEEALFAFLKKIHEKLSPTFFFVWGNDREKEVADRLEREFAHSSHTIGGMSLPLWQRFMNEVEGVIAMDSASLHLCATTTTPSFSLFGPSSSKVYKPTGAQHYAFQGSCPYGVSFEKRCPHLRSCHTGACLREVSPDTLFSHFERFWDGANGVKDPLNDKLRVEKDLLVGLKS